LNWYQRLKQTATFQQFQPWINQRVQPSALSFKVRALAAVIRPVRASGPAEKTFVTHANQVIGINLLEECAHLRDPIR